MPISADIKQISPEEKKQIHQQVKVDLVDHLYKGCLPGTVSGMVASVAIFIDYYGYTSTKGLIAWVIFFNVMMISLSALYFTYNKIKPQFELNSWEWAYSVMMSLCAVAWIPCILLLPSDINHQYLALLAIFLATTGYATGTIGQFQLCLVTLNIILIPLIIWCLLRGGLFYDIMAVFSAIYMSFMIGTNHRSTQWFKDSLKLKLENTLVSYQANHDFLTHLPNQRLLPQFIASAIQSVKSTGETFVLVCFSLNRMEMIDDSLGLQVSNSLIRSVADRLHDLVGQFKEQGTQCVVTISRKDTFNILWVPIVLEEIENKLKQLFAVLDDPFYLEKKGIKITASAGICIYPKDGSDAQSLLMNADAAMLQAKQFGGNHYEFYRAEINAQIPKQLELENDLHIALKEKQLQLYYQPLLDLHSGEISGMEALIRWPHPVHGFISPMHFIPLAEETGLILPIGEWVIQEACRQTRLWHDMGFSTLRIAVNLSQKQLKHKQIIDTLRRILEETPLDPQFLELEITETAILDESVIPVIKEFKNLGLSLSVDDFGTGYSGLSYLKRFAIDKLKIDQSFIRDIPANNDSMTIVSAILAMAKELHVATLAEGVETIEQMRFLLTKDCDYVQGYFFSKPLDTQFFTQLLLSGYNLAACADIKETVYKE